MDSHKKRKKKYSSKGITMISLIVTVVVLIILAGITITSLTGDNSVLGKANSAKVVQIEAASKEKMDLASQAIVIAIAESKTNDRNYSAKENAAAIQNKLLEILKLDSSNNTEKEGWKVGLLDEAAGKFEITYEGEDYKSACNDDNAKIIYTVVLGEKTIDITSTATGLKDSYGNKVEIGLGNGTDSGDSGDSGDEPEHTHTSDNGTVTKNATCTTIGVRTYKCTSCNATIKTENIPAFGHSEDSGTVTIQAGCTTKGVKTYKCTVCSTVTKTEEIPANGHTSVDGKEENIHKKCSVCGTTLEDGSKHNYSSKVTTAGNCTTDEVTTYTCGCGYKYTAVTKEATGHSQDNGTVTKLATCTEKGTKTYKCTVCGTTTKTEEIAATGHTSVDGKEENIHKKCSVCGVTLEDGEEHDYTSKVTTAGNCTTDEVTTYTCECGYKYTAVTKEAPGHSQDNGTVTKPATCTEKGTKTYKCTVCSTVTKTEEIPATGHSEDGGTVTKEATCTETGTKVIKCTVCSAELRTEEIPVNTDNHSDEAELGAYLVDQVEIGDYVDIGIEYTNTTSVLKGWRVLSTNGDGASGTVTLVSAGYPLYFYYLENLGMDAQTIINTYFDDLNTEIEIIEYKWGKDSTSNGFTENGFSSNNLASVWSSNDNIDASTVHILTTTEVEKVYAALTGTTKTISELDNMSSPFSISTMTALNPNMSEKAYDLLYFDGYFYWLGGSPYDEVDLYGVWDDFLSFGDGGGSNGVRVVMTLKSGVQIAGDNTGTGADVSTAYKLVEKQVEYEYKNENEHTVKTICSECNEVKSSTTEAHSWDAGKVTTAATCTVAGVRTYTCTGCKTTKTESIAATGHTYNQTNTSTTYRISTATCQKAATYYKSCSCGASSQGTSGEATFTSGSTAKHNYTYESSDSKYLRTEVDCTTDETYWYRCLWCDAKSSDSYWIKTEATGHPEEELTSLSSVANVGDYVNYDPTNVSVENESKTTYTSEKGSTLQHGNGYGAQTFSAEAYKASGGKWQILEKNDDGTITLISDLIYRDNENSTAMLDAADSNGLYLNGALGYLWAEEELHRIGAIYGYGKGADTSQTVTYYYGGPNDQDGSIEEIDSNGDGTTDNLIELQEGRKKTLDLNSGGRALTENDINRICQCRNTFSYGYKFLKDSNNARYYPTLVNTADTSTGISVAQSDFSGSYYNTYYEDYFISSSNSDSKVATKQNSMLLLEESYYLGSRVFASERSGYGSFGVRTYIKDEGIVYGLRFLMSK